MRISLARVLLGLAVVVGGTNDGQSQTNDAPPSISTDRPGQATTPSLLLPGAVQLESGVQLTSDVTSTGQAETAIRISTAPTVLVRIGVLPTMELRLSTEFRTVRTTVTPGGVDTTTNGLAGAGVGTKLGVTAENGAIPETAFLLTMALPVGSEAFRVTNVAPTFLFATRSGLFGEVYGTLSTGARPVHSADVGVAYLAGDNMQFDIYGGAGITDNAPDYFIAGGISVRLPH